MTEASISNFLFPPPKFLLMPAAGIDISDTSIKFAELIPGAQGFRLGSFGTIPLPAGVVSGGRIDMPQKLQEILESLRLEHRFSFVRVSLPDEQTYFFRMTLPDAPMAVLRETLELSLEEHVPIPVPEAVFDFTVVGRVGADVEVAVTAASRTVVESYTQVFANAGLTMLSLELEADALARSVIVKSDPVARLIVDFGETRTGIAVVYAGAVYFTSTVGLGGQMLTDTLAKHFSISVADAEKMKREVGLRRTDSNQDLFSLLLNNVAVLRDEINKHFIYWHTHPDEKGNARPPIEEILLVGGDSNLSGFPEYLSASLHVKTSVADVWTNVDIPTHGVPDIPREESLGYATAIGLSLRSTNL